MTNKKSIDFKKKKYISEIPTVNRKKEEFLKKSNDFISENIEDVLKVSRIIDLCKYTDLIFYDNGKKSETYKECLKLINKININSKNKLIKKKISKFIYDINSINDIVSQKERNNNIIKNSNVSYLNTEDKYLDINIYLQKCMDNNNEIDINKLNISDNLYSAKDDLLLNSAIKNWKYGDADIKRKNGFFIIDGLSDTALSFIRTRDLFEQQRHFVNDIAYQKRMLNYNTRFFATVYGINELSYGEDLYKYNKSFDDLLESIYNGSISYDYRKIRWIKEQKSINMKDGTKISILRIIEFLNKLKCNINTIKINEYFSKISFDHNDKEEIYFIINNLTLKKNVYIKDMLDTPFIKGNDSNIYILNDIIDYVDPSSIIGKLLESDNGDKVNKRDRWSAVKGTNFEKRIEDILNKKFKGIPTSGPIRSGESEIDGLISHNNKSSVLEMKTFPFPTDIREYKMNIDKMYCDEYERHLENNFKAFKSDKFRNAIDKKLSNFSSSDFPTKKAKAFLISNYIFPKNIIGNSKIVNYLHQYEFTTYSNAKDIPYPIFAFPTFHFEGFGMLLNDSPGAKIYTNTNDAYSVLSDISRIQPYKNSNSFFNRWKLIKNTSNCYINDIYDEVYKSLFEKMFNIKDSSISKRIASYISNYYSPRNYDSKIFNYIYPYVNESQVNEIYHYIYCCQVIMVSELKYASNNLDDHCISKNYL